MKLSLAVLNSLLPVRRNLLRNGQYLASVHPIRDACGYLGEHEGSVRDARGAAISSYLSALPTIQVHPELDGR